MFKKIKTFFYRLLRRSEQYTKTDMLFLAHSGFWLSAAQVVSTAAGFLLAVAFANLVPKEVYGTYKYFLSVLGILSIPTLNSMSTALIKAVAQGYEGSLVPILKTKIRWGFFGTLGSLAVAVYYWINGNDNFAIAFLIVAVLLPFMNAFALFDSFLQGKKLFKISSHFNIAIKICATAIMVITLYLSNNVIWILLAYLISYTVLRFIFFQITLKKYLKNTRHDPTAISYGKHLSFMVILNSIVVQFDNVLVWHYMTPVSLAIYSIAIAPTNQIKSLLKSLLAISVPKLASQDRSIIRKTLLAKIVRYVIVFIPLTLAFIFLLPYVYKIFFPQYLESIKYAQVFALTIILFPERLFSMSLIAHAKKKELYLTNILNPLFHLILVLILLPQFGIMGLIVAILIHQSLYTFVDYYFFKKL